MGAEEQAPILTNSDQIDGTTQVAETQIQGAATSSEQLKEVGAPVGSLGICPKCKDRPAEVSFFAAASDAIVASFLFSNYLLSIRFSLPSPVVYCTQELYQLFSLLRSPFIPQNKRHFEE
jgi:hypothetical protein